MLPNFSNKINYPNQTTTTHNPPSINLHLSKDKKFYHLQITPSQAAKFRKCFADSECKRLLGVKAHDLGITETLLYTGEYRCYVERTDADAVVINSTQPIWVQIPKQEFEAHPSTQPWYKY